MTTNPYDFINEISHGKKDIMHDDLEEEAYNPYITNRQLSYFPDTVMLANEMNVQHHLDKKLQFSFLLNTVRKRKRFSKWFKPELESDLEAVKEYYGYSNDKARQSLTLLTEEDLVRIRKKVNKGGKTK